MSYEKKISLYGDGIGSVDYIQHMGSDLTIVNSARVSYGKEKEKLDSGDQKLIKYLLDHKHSSPFEHCSITFRFTVPMYISKQHMRHRTWSYNEISRRYTDVDLQFYSPKSFRSQHKTNRQASNNDAINPTLGNLPTRVMAGARFSKAPLRADKAVAKFHKDALRLYHDLIEYGVCREQARGVLPQNLYTQYFGTANLNNIFKFIALRLPSDAQWEIQSVARAVLEITSNCFPVATEAWMNSNKIQKPKKTDDWFIEDWSQVLEPDIPTIEPEAKKSSFKDFFSLKK